ncbi:hypothetical protein [Dietzia cinnamea]|uniref:hypothetical protein n=1 Tax=Dietzia cinnamea TaxID=321318 RepID=UPI00223B00ED|nr:hypothetical protein [Dietzia cinnamea]MCT2175577.1 hypothetical protein [Dietzia cinnamea]
MTSNAFFEIAGVVAEDPVHQLAGVDSSALHATMLHWLATSGGVDRIWELAGLRGPFCLPEGATSDLAARRGQILLDDGFGLSKAVIQCCFESCPSADELEVHRARALNSFKLRQIDDVKWNVFTLGSRAVPFGSAWRAVSIDEVIAAVEESGISSDPAAQAYCRYLGRLVELRDAAELLGGDGFVGLSKSGRLGLKESGVLSICELAEQYWLA